MAELKIEDWPVESFHVVQNCTLVTPRFYAMLHDLKVTLFDILRLGKDSLICANDSHHVLWRVLLVQADHLTCSCPDEMELNK